MRRQVLHLVVAAGLLVAATACEDLGPTGGEEQQPAGQATPQTPAPDEDEDEDGGTAPAAPSPPPDGVIASKEFPTGDTTMLVEITTLERRGQSVQLIWTMTNIGDEDRVLNLVGGVVMGGDPENPRGGNGTVDGTTLVDPVNGKRYLVARAGGEDGPCVCSDVAPIYMDPDDSNEYNALFSAPPSDVTEVNVSIQTLGVITNVPIY